METVADRLRDARLKAGYATGSDAARAFGWPVSTYLGHENGDRNPNLKTLEKYGKAFGVDYFWLLNSKHNREPSQFDLVRHEQDITLVGLVRSDGSVDPQLNEKYGNSKVIIKIPLNTAHELVAIEVIGNYGPRYDVGDIIICRIGYDDPFPFIGKYCLIETDEGNWYLGQLRAGRDKKKFDLAVVGDTVVENITPIQIGSVYLLLPHDQISPPRGFVERVRVFGEPREPPDAISPARMAAD